MRLPHIYIYIDRMSVYVTGPIYAGCKMDKMAALCIVVACDSNSCHEWLQMGKEIIQNEADTPTSLPGKDTSIGRRNIANYAREFHRTLSKVVCRSLLFTMPTGMPLRRTVSNTTASEPSGRSSPGLCNANIYIRRAFSQGSIIKCILMIPASTIYTLFVLNTKESRNQYGVTHYGSKR